MNFILPCKSSVVWKIQTKNVSDDKIIIQTDKQKLFSALEKCFLIYEKATNKTDFHISSSVTVRVSL